jgi:hypothetical protein
MPGLAIAINRKPFAPINSFKSNAYMLAHFGNSMGQKTVACRECGKRFLVPAVDTGRQEISPEISEDASFALICPFCLAHAAYTAKDLQ